MATAQHELRPVGESPGHTWLDVAQPEPVTGLKPERIIVPGVRAGFVDHRFDRVAHHVQLAARLELSEGRFLDLSKHDIELGPPGECAHFAASAAAIAAFLDETYELVPIGAESDFLNLEAELAAWLDGA